MISLGVLKLNLKISSYHVVVVYCHHMVAHVKLSAIFFVYVLCRTRKNTDSLIGQFLRLSNTRWTKNYQLNKNICLQFVLLRFIYLFLTLKCIMILENRILLILVVIYYDKYFHILSEKLANQVFRYTLMTSLLSVSLNCEHRVRTEY